MFFGVNSDRVLTSHIEGLVHQKRASNLIEMGSTLFYFVCSFPVSMNNWKTLNFP
jgi:hypothetical protein